jgi:hypothetical protein
MMRRFLLALLLSTACQHQGGAPAAAPAPEVARANAAAGPEPAKPETAHPSDAAKEDPAADAEAAERRLAAASDPDEERLYQLERARALFQEFIARTEGKAEFEEPLQRARERVADIGAEIEFVRQGLAERGLREGDGTE